jgi:hypothetical protein
VDVSLEHVINKDKGGILQYLDGAGAYVNASIEENTRIDINFSSFENDNEQRHDYVRRFYAKNQYVGDATKCAFERFLESNETSWANQQVRTITLQVKIFSE